MRIWRHVEFILDFETPDNGDGDEWEDPLSMVIISFIFFKTKGF